LQIVTKEGKEKYLDLDKLAALADLQLPEQPPVSEVEDAASCDDFKGGVPVHRIWYPAIVKLDG
jgi:hypothetical protein